VGTDDYLAEFEHLVLLALVRMGREGYGMTVRRELQKTSGREIAIGSVYATLDRLERKGYVSSSRSDPDPVRGGRSRRHFQVEQRGLTALAQTRSLLDRMWDGVSIDPDSAR
jgi:DNA-binding PadR family transcriptional regulator